MEKQKKDTGKVTLVKEQPKVKKPSAVAVMRDIFKKTNRIRRADLVAQVVAEAGVLKWTPLNAIAAAKRDAKLLGFKLTEVQNKKGEGVLCKKG